MEQRSPEWYAARKGRITASMVGAILGNNPNMSKEDAMRLLVREWHDAPREFAGNIATDYGERNEPNALFEYKIETGHEVQSVGFVTKEDWAGCSPDGLIGLVGGLEIKCPFGKRKIAQEGESIEFKTIWEQPHYYDQVQFSMWVCERAWWDFFQWGPTKTDMIRVQPDSEWRTKNLKKLRAFYEKYLIEREQPKAQAHLEERRVNIDTPQALQKLSEYDDLVEAIEQAEARKKEVLADLVALVGERNATLCGRNLTKIVREGSIAYARVVKDLLPGADLESYRGKKSEYWKIS